METNEKDFSEQSTRLFAEMLLGISQVQRSETTAESRKHLHDIDLDQLEQRCFELLAIEVG